MIRKIGYGDTLATNFWDRGRNPNFNKHTELLQLRDFRTKESFNRVSTNLQENDELLYLFLTKFFKDYIPKENLGILNGIGKEFKLVGSDFNTTSEGDLLIRLPSGAAIIPDNGDLILFENKPNLELFKRQYYFNMGLGFEGEGNSINLQHEELTIEVEEKDHFYKMLLNMRGSEYFFGCANRTEFNNPSKKGVSVFDFIKAIKEPSSNNLLHILDENATDRDYDSYFLEPIFKISKNELDELEEEPLFIVFNKQTKLLELIKKQAYLTGYHFVLSVFDKHRNIQNNHEFIKRFNYGLDVKKQTNLEKLEVKEINIIEDLKSKNGLIFEDFEIRKNLTVKEDALIEKDLTVKEDVLIEKGLTVKENVIIEKGLSTKDPFLKIGNAVLDKSFGLEIKEDIKFGFFKGDTIEIPEGDNIEIPEGWLVNNTKKEGNPLQIIPLIDKTVYEDIYDEISDITKTSVLYFDKETNSIKKIENVYYNIKTESLVLKNLEVENLEVKNELKVYSKTTTEELIEKEL